MGNKQLSLIDKKTRGQSHKMKWIRRSYRPVKYDSPTDHRNIFECLKELTPKTKVSK